MTLWLLSASLVIGFLVSIPLSIARVSSKRWVRWPVQFYTYLFKTALVVILTFDAMSWTTLSPSLITNLIPGLFILPYVVFSATAGQLADKFEKAGLTRMVKWLEVAIMAVAGLGWMTHNLWLLIVAVVGMGVHSTLFGPVK